MQQGPGLCMTIFAGKHPIFLYLLYQLCWILRCLEASLIPMKLAMKSPMSSAWTPHLWRFLSVSTFRMDTSGNGDLDATEFVEGCMRLKGPARSIDVSLLMQEHKRPWDAEVVGDGVMELEIGRIQNYKWRFFHMNGNFRKWMMGGLVEIGNCEPSWVWLGGMN